MYLHSVIINLQLALLVVESAITVLNSFKTDSKSHSRKTGLRQCQICMAQTTGVSDRISKFINWVKQPFKSLLGLLARSVPNLKMFGLIVYGPV